MVKAEQVHKFYGRFEVLKGVSLEVATREVMCIVGPSGSGKSTFLRCINHLEPIHAGRLSVNGHLVGYRERGGKLYEMNDKEVARQRLDIGMVFQRFNLFPHLTALQNVMEAPLRVKGEPKDVVRERAEALLERVGLGDRGGSYPTPDVRRPAAACGDRAGAGHGAEADALRRADVGAGPGAGRRGPRCDAPARRDRG